MDSPYLHVSEFYDELYDTKDYSAEVDFIKNLSTLKSHHNVLELAGGTGNHANYLAKTAENYCFTELSSEMLKVAKEKLASYDGVRIMQMNMLDFAPLKKEKFDLILCLFDSIGYLQSQSNILVTLENITNHLKDKGQAIIEYWNAGAFLRSYEPFRVRKIRTPEYSLTRISETYIDYELHLAKVMYTYFVENKNGITKFEEMHKNRFFLPKEFETLLKQSGLAIEGQYDGYSLNSVTEDSWHVVVHIVKK